MSAAAKFQRFEGPDALMAWAIETDRLSKSFGEIDAVIDLDLRVATGEIFGFLGPNGAGKSTAIRLFLDELRPTSGSARLLALDTHRDLLELHRRIGYLPGELALPKDLTGDEYLDFLASLRGTRDSSFRQQLIERLDLDPSRRLGQLSTGNKQKVGLVQAFMHRPELVLLDEPTSGLDPLVQHDFHELLTDLAADGTTIFLSSHALSEVDRVAHRVGIIRAGRLVAVDTITALKAQARRRIVIELESPLAVELLDGLASVVEATAEAHLLTVTIEGTVDALLRRVLEHRSIVSIRTPEVDLEEVFLDYYRTESSTP